MNDDTLTMATLRKRATSSLVGYQGPAVEDDLGGIAFERETGNKLRAIGWQVETTPATGDFGADLVARSGTETLVVQCKDHGAPVGIGAVQEITFARLHYRATLCLVVARSGFTKAATQGATTANVILMTPADLRAGSVLDRTRDQARRQADEKSERARREAARAAAFEKQRQAARENEGRLAEAWRQYERDLPVAEQLLRIYYQRIVWVAFVGLLAFFVQSLLDRYSFQVAGTGWILLTLYLRFAWPRLRNPPALPHRPAGERSKAVIMCDVCDVKLRVDRGRIGLIRCPSCESLVAART